MFFIDEENYCMKCVGKKKYKGIVFFSIVGIIVGVFLFVFGVFLFLNFVDMFL